MMSLDDIKISFSLFFCSKNLPNDIIFETLTMKSQQDEEFYIKIFLLKALFQLLQNQYACISLK